MLTAAPRQVWAHPAPQRALTHGHTRTHAGRHTSMLTGAAALSSQLVPSRCPRAPYLAQLSAPRVEQPPAQGRAAGGGGEGAPESRAKLPLIRAGRGGAPTSERGLPGGGHLRTSPPTHAAVWAPSPISPAPPSFRQLRQASPHPTPHPRGNAWGGGMGEGEHGANPPRTGRRGEEGKCGDALGA